MPAYPGTMCATPTYSCKCIKHEYILLFINNHTREPINSVDIERQYVIESTFSVSIAFTNHNRDMLGIMTFLQVKN